MKENINISYKNIKEKLIRYETSSVVMDYTKEQVRVKAYFDVGKILSEAGKEYGKDIIGKFSDRLMTEVNKNIM